MWWMKRLFLSPDAGDGDGGGETDPVDPKTQDADSDESKGGGDEESVYIEDVEEDAGPDAMAEIRRTNQRLDEVTESIKNASPTKSADAIEEGDDPFAGDAAMRQLSEENAELKKSVDGMRSEVSEVTKTMHSNRMSGIRAEFQAQARSKMTALVAADSELPNAPENVGIMKGYVEHLIMGPSFNPEANFQKQLDGVEYRIKDWALTNRTNITREARDARQAKKEKPEPTKEEEREKAIARDKAEKANVATSGGGVGSPAGDAEKRPTTYAELRELAQTEYETAIKG